MPGLVDKKDEIIDVSSREFGFVWRSRALMGCLG